MADPGVPARRGLLARARTVVGTGTHAPARPVHGTSSPDFNGAVGAAAPPPAGPIGSAVRGATPPGAPLVAPPRSGRKLSAVAHVGRTR